MNISEVTRRDIIDYLASGYQIEGRLSIVDFLSKIWPIHNIMWKGTRYYLADEIHRHMIYNSDWEYNYLFYDCLEILQCSDEIFGNLLEWCIHPAVRTDREAISSFLSVFNDALAHDGYILKENSYVSGKPIYKMMKMKEGVKGRVKNLIFASNGPKPEIVLIDSVNNDIQIVENEQFCLVYDRQILEHGLSWIELTNWWSERQKLTKLSEREQQLHLYKRLLESLDSSPPERLLFRTYFEKFKKALGDKLPALIPQVYLHYDPYTITQLQQGKRLVRQRMDFLLLFSNKDRIIIEVDGQQHYSEKGVARPNLYAEMVAEDRRLRLAGYEIYRFGGYELNEEKGKAIVTEFFHSLFQNYSVS